MANLQKRINTLLNAIKSNDPERICKILVKNRDLVNHPECVDKDGASPLWSAMLEKYENIVELLVRDFGADPDEKCRIKDLFIEGCSFLELAVKYDNAGTSKMFKLAEILTKHGADVNAEVEVEKDECLWSEKLLRIALFMRGNYEFVELLLKNGVNLDGEGSSRMDSIMSYILKQKKNRKKLLLLFMKYGLDTSDYTDRHYKQNQLHVFISNHVDADDEDAVEIAKILIKKHEIPIDSVDENNSSALYHAVQAQNVPLASFFIHKGADVNRKSEGPKGRFPLLIAAERGNLDLVKLLLANGADVNAYINFGWTVLHCACIIPNYHESKIKEKIIRLLLQRGAAVSGVNQNLESPFGTLLSYYYQSDDCNKLMIREFSKLSFEEIPIFKEDLKRIESDESFREYFENCLAELRVLASTKFYGHFTYYSILKTSKNINKLAFFSKNDEFLANFEENLDCCLYYKNDLEELLEEAVQVKNQLMAVESRLKYVFGSLFPDIVIRILADNLSLEYLPLD